MQITACVVTLAQYMFHVKHFTNIEDIPIRMVCLLSEYHLSEPTARRDITIRIHFHHGCEKHVFKDAISRVLFAPTSRGVFLASKVGTYGTYVASPLSPFRPCHPERSEGSVPPRIEDPLLRSG